MKKYDVVIIGGGPAGISAAIWCRRLGLDHLLLEEKDQLGGQLLQIHNKIIDYPGVITETGLELQKFFAKHVHETKCNVLYNTKVLKIDHKKKIIYFTETNEYKKVRYGYLVVATGSSQRLLRVPGEKEMIDRGEVYSATRDRYRFSGKNVAIVGGGDRAFEGVILLAEAGANVFLIHHSTTFRAKKMYQEKVFRLSNVEVITNGVVRKIHDKNKVQCIEIEKLGEVKQLSVDGVLIRIGMEPNNCLVKDFLTLDDDGYIIVDKMGRTSEKSIFAIGDICNTAKYSSIAASVGQGMITIKYIFELLNSEDI